MRVLWLVPYDISSPTHGGKIRVHNLVRQMALRGHENEVWSITDEPPANSVTPPKDFRLRRFPARPRTRTIDKLRSAVSPLPTAAWSERSPDVVKALNEAREHDIAIVCQAPCGSLAPELRRAGRPWLFDSHNVEWWLTRQISRRLNNPMTSMRFAVDAVKFKRLERELMQTATSINAVSEEDAAMLRQLAPARTVEVRPNGVDTEYFTFVDHTEPKGVRLIMTGTLGYYPNLDASLWLIDEVLPLIRKRLPAASVTLVGGQVTDELRSKAAKADGVNVVGQVPDVRPYVADADVFLIPLRVGSGTRIKALEALSSGIPIVATRLAVAGLGLDKRHLALLGDTAEELAKAVETSIKDQPTRARLVREGRRFVVEHFDWSRIGADFEKTLLRTADV